MITALDDKLRAVAEAPVLLVASDFDGTLSELVSEIGAARPFGSCVHSLVALAGLAHTHAAIVSGRGRAELVRLSGAPAGVWLVGSHGAEDADGHAPRAPERLLDELAFEVGAIASRGGGAGLVVERKPLGVALHYRRASEADAEAARAAVLDGPARRAGVHVRHGSMVVELCVTPANKGGALAALRHRVGASAVVFIGDDPTDEDALRTLGPVDLGIKVGEAPSAAAVRVAGVPGVQEVLARLVEMRSAWLTSRQIVPLNSLSVLSDQRTLAVVDGRGRVLWHCVPRVDSSSVFGSLVGGDGAGSFEIGPPGGSEGKQRYEGDSFVLVTEWEGVRLTDYLDCSGGRAYQRAGRSDLVRIVEGTGGAGQARIRFAPRLDFGRVATKLRVHAEGLEVDGSPEPLVLRSAGVSWVIKDEGQHQSAEAVVDLNVGGGPVVLELRSGSGNLREGVVAERARRRETVRFWSGWAGALSLPELHREAVKRSALVLKALCHGPTGAIIAAATTSLPEHLGGVRNWDYRFCWPRDATLAAAALVRLGNTGHALKLLDWMMAVVDECETPDRLRPIYTVTGRHLPPEAEIGQLTGYGESRPVRISNAAANQVQLDVFGPIVDLVALLAERGAPISPDHWRLVRAMVRAVEARWTEPDHGIWEIRAERRHHVHSKVMCWQTVSRALKVMEHVLGRRDAAWVRLAEEIREDVLTNGFSESAAGGHGAFTIAYGSANLDAAALMTGLTGLVKPDDERFVRTVEAVNRVLREGPVVYRYLEDDGLPGREGGMLICAGWLIESLALVGRRDEARSLLDGLVGLMGPTGVLTEQYCPKYGIALGNVAQAYSHLAVVNGVVGVNGLNA